MVKVHVDASRGEFVSGIGYVLEGEVHESGTHILNENVTSMEAEFFALVEGIRIASLRVESREYCEVYSDAKPLVSKMRGDERHSGDWQDYYNSFHWLIGKFDSWDIEYVPREHNEDAHQLAREALFKGRSFNE